MSVAKLPDVAILGSDTKEVMSAVEILGVVNDVLEAKKTGLKFVIIPSQTDSHIVGWMEVD